MFFFLSPAIGMHSSAQVAGNECAISRDVDNFSRRARADIMPRERGLLQTHNRPVMEWKPTGDTMEVSGPSAALAFVY